MANDYTFPMAEPMLDLVIKKVRDKNYTKEQMVQSFSNFSAAVNPEPQVLGTLVGLLLHRVVELERRQGVTR